MPLRDGREVGEEIPISFPTAFPLEMNVVTDTSTEASNVLINIRTLVRNFYSSYAQGEQPPVPKALELIIGEMRTVTALLEQIDVNIDFYHCTYANVKLKVKDAKVKSPNTPNQKFYDDYESAICKALRAMSVEDLPEVLRFDTRLNPPNTKGITYVITHIPIDLLSWTKFTDLRLLESNTGKLKTRKEWSSKLKTKVPNMPLNLLTMTICGDSGNMFKPFTPKIKRTLEGVAEKNRWSAFTSKAKMLSDLNKIEKEWGDVFIRILNTTLI